MSQGWLSEVTAMIYTIGHSKHPIDRFIALLQRHGINALADVRSTPFSRFNPQFNRNTLQATLAEAGIEYVFLGEELGARSKDPACYEGGQVSYAKLAATPLFQRGIARLETGMTNHKVAIMCAEKEPLDCHRTILVSRELRRRGIPVAHILESGELEPHEATLGRLRARLKMPLEGDLFGGEQALNEQAYELRARKIAYAPRGS
jgi:uncharacterized protein (DUF488 family)